MTMFYWHIHHEILLEASDSIQERIDYVQANKLAHEIETRLRWMTPVAGDLPQALRKAVVEYAKAWAEYDKGLAEYDKAGVKYLKYLKARAEYLKTRAKYDKAWAEYRPKVEALHAIEHPGCPWNGETLFP